MVKETKNAMRDKLDKTGMGGLHERLYGVPATTPPSKPGTDSVPPERPISRRYETQPPRRTRIDSIVIDGISENEGMNEEDSQDFWGIYKRLLSYKGDPERLVPLYRAVLADNQGELEREVLLDKVYNSMRRVINELRSGEDPLIVYRSQKENAGKSDSLLGLSYFTL
ncbi:MAG: hypothetical protein ACE5FT_00215 [Candidatus Nanoarchaeia archaeon]